MIRDLSTFADSSRQYVAWRRRRAHMLNRRFAEYGQASEAAGAAAGASATRSVSESVFIGVATGVSVWFLTRVLDRMFGGLSK